MSSSIQSIKLWGQDGPNPIKVAILLAELAVPYEMIDWPFVDVKKSEYTALNPNGRLPTIQDPNTGLKLWESGAIIEYLIEKYDKDREFSFEPGTEEHYLTRQWLFFQVSGQGPYYGQAVWFTKYHPEYIPGAIERYTKEIHRVCGVLEGWLIKQKAQHEGTEGFTGPWLVGNKMTYADLAFITWQLGAGARIGVDLSEYRLVQEWIEKMAGREKVKAVLENSQFGKPSPTLQTVR